VTTPGLEPAASLGIRCEGALWPPCAEEGGGQNRCTGGRRCVRHGPISGGLQACFHDRVPEQKLVPVMSLAGLQTRVWRRRVTRSLALESDIKSNSDSFCAVVLRARKDGRVVREARCMFWIEKG
jgi:hypothetical protein